MEKVFLVNEINQIKSSYMDEANFGKSLLLVLLLMTQFIFKSRQKKRRSLCGVSGVSGVS